MDVTNKVGQEAEGKIKIFVGEDQISTEELKSFAFDSPNQLITTEYPEFSAVCPFSGLPDIAHVTIKYKPAAGRAVELKALKYYMLSFRNVGIYQEGVTARIYRDLMEALELKWDEIYVKTVYNVRGGFLTTCEEGAV